MINNYSSIPVAMLLMLSIGLSGCIDQPGTTVKISDFSFQPASISVTTGSTVVWTNEDSVSHTITADDGSFDSGSIAGGSRFEHIFSQSGTYRYHCSIHPSMTGEVAVSEAESGSPSMPNIGLMLVADGLVAPMEFIPSGDGRMFIVEQTGVVKAMLANGTMLDEPFLDVRDRMVPISTGYDERGLLGLAFHPEFAKNGRLFVFYSAPLRAGAPLGWACTSRISEFRISAENADQVNMSSERILLEVDKPQSNHNGGTIAFGPEGYLYIPLGDGGGAGDSGMGHAAGGNAQSTSTPLGKILRIDVDNQSDDMSYGIPADNPFSGMKDILPEIWAYGFRNPWRITFDQGGDHNLFVSDAGQNLWEEVDLVTKGGNYGWRIREGTHCFDPGNSDGDSGGCPDRGARGEPLIEPVIEYGHDLGTAVVGGYVYRGKAIPELKGKYIFADWSASSSRGNGILLAAAPSLDGLWEWKELAVAGNPAGRIDALIRSFGQDDEGEIYVLTSNEGGPRGETGKIFKIVPA